VATAAGTRRFPDGVWLVSLAPIEDPQLVTQSVFQALGLQDHSVGWRLSTLADSIGDKHLLLILDNCEHLVDTCAVLATTLLKSCPELGLLATSRQPLGTVGEARMRVPSLSFPVDGGLVPAESLISFEAVVLLIERAAAVQPGFRVDQTNAADVLRLCQRLDGIPLALELAAGRLEGLSLARLNQELDLELSVLGGANRGAEARQRTLEATIGWSYGLLDADEQRLWARLSVFAGGFDEEAAVYVCSDAALPSERVSKVLAALVDKSIVKRDPNFQPARYELLETLRQYGRQRLRESGEELEIQRRHCDWVVVLAQAVGAWDHRQADLFDRVQIQHDNVWAALDFCLHNPGEVAKGVEIGCGLMAYWASRGPVDDVRRLLAALLELTEEDSLPRGRCSWAAGNMAANLNDYATMGAMNEESVRIGRLLDDAELVAASLAPLGLARVVDGKLTEAVQVGESAVSLAREIQSPPLTLLALSMLCAVRLAAGAFDDVIRLGDEALAISRERGELFLRGFVLNFLSQARWQQGEREQAEAQAQEGAVCKYQLDDRAGLAIVIETLASLSAERGAFERAATLLGCAEALRESFATTVLEQWRAQHERSVALTTERLGQAGFNTTFQRGRSMTSTEAVNYATGREVSTKRPAFAVAKEPMPLTRRELEVAVLVAEGLSNKQIAAKLVVSERTAEYHILNILNKLGFNSRTQIASWATEHQPLAARKP